MSEDIICALERKEKARQARRQGFIPAVVFGKGIESVSIKMDQKDFRRVFQGRFKTSRISLKLGDEVKNCIIKEVQRDPINGQILHVDLQTIHSDDIIRLKMPVVFQGKEKLAANRHLLQEFITEVEISGKAADLPEYISIDAGNMELGDKITVGDLPIGDGIKVLEEADVILAVVSAAKIDTKAEDKPESGEEGEAASEEGEAASDVE
jgi:large subunit ribosomal protein L25